MRTWHVEMVFVFVVLATVARETGGGIQWLSAAAVLLSFGHVQVADRMAASQARLAVPDVHCHAMLVRYLVGKELLWSVFFVTTRAWSALAGVAIFTLYPVWRAYRVNARAS